ncbi:methyltransferase family protein [Streptomyces noursei]|uniref:methyltransferase family protein n=1 Tax=Streptomyces noursei TaxID=1971 RepID=UPI001F03FD8B|nr:methyltransferase [Streptomyces noursei]
MRSGGAYGLCGAETDAAGSRFPLLKNAHAGGHLWNDLTGWRGDPHLSPFHLASYVAIGGGFWLIAAAWRVLHTAVQHDALATTGPYARVRHPQYDGLLLVMIGFLLQWPTLPTLIMFPILVYVYIRLARSEELAALFTRLAGGPAHCARRKEVEWLINRSHTTEPCPRTSTRGRTPFRQRDGCHRTTPD